MLLVFRVRSNPNRNPASERDCIATELSKPLLGIFGKRGDCSKIVKSFDGLLSRIPTPGDNPFRKLPIHHKSFLEPSLALATGELTRSRDRNKVNIPVTPSLQREEAEELLYRHGIELRRIMRRFENSRDLMRWELAANRGLELLQ